MKGFASLEALGAGLVIMGGIAFAAMAIGLWFGGPLRPQVIVLFGALTGGFMVSLGSRASLKSRVIGAWLATALVWALALLPGAAWVPLSGVLHEGLLVALGRSEADIGMLAWSIDVVVLGGLVLGGGYLGLLLAEANETATPRDYSATIGLAAAGVAGAILTMATVLLALYAMSDHAPSDSTLRGELIPAYAAACFFGGYFVQRIAARRVVLDVLLGALAGMFVYSYIQWGAWTPFRPAWQLFPLGALVALVGAALVRRPGEAAVADGA